MTQSAANCSPGRKLTLFSGKIPGIRANEGQTFGKRAWRARRFCDKFPKHRNRESVWLIRESTFHQDRHDEVGLDKWLTAMWMIANDRKAAGDWERTSELVSQALDKRLTYAELIGKFGETQN
jgi:hypothetical protein